MLDIGAGGSSLPVGTIIEAAGVNDASWLECSQGYVLASAYPDLASAVGDRFASVYAHGTALAWRLNGSAGFSSVPSGGYQTLYDPERGIAWGRIQGVNVAYFPAYSSALVDGYPDSDFAMTNAPDAARLSGGVGFLLNRSQGEVGYVQNGGRSRNTNLITIPTGSYYVSGIAYNPGNGHTLCGFTYNGTSGERLVQKAASLASYFYSPSYPTLAQLPANVATFPAYVNGRWLLFCSNGKVLQNLNADPDSNAWTTLTSSAPLSEIVLYSCANVTYEGGWYSLLGNNNPRVLRTKDFVSWESLTAAQTGGFPVYRLSDDTWVGAPDGVVETRYTYLSDYNGGNSNASGYRGIHSLYAPTRNGKSYLSHGVALGLRDPLRPIPSQDRQRGLYPLTPDLWLGLDKNYADTNAVVSAHKLPRSDLTARVYLPPSRSQYANWEAMMAPSHASHVKDFIKGK